MNGMGIGGGLINSGPGSASAPSSEMGNRRNWVSVRLGYQGRPLPTSPRATASSSTYLDFQLLVLLLPLHVPGTSTTKKKASGRWTVPTRVVEGGPSIEVHLPPFMLDLRTEPIRGAMTNASEAGGGGVTGSFLEDTVTPGREFRIEDLFASICSARIRRWFSRPSLRYSPRRSLH